MKYESMKGKKGFIYKDCEQNIYFREYFPNGEFNDYRIYNDEIEIIIVDEDCYSYGDHYLNYSKETLGN